MAKRDGEMEEWTRQEMYTSAEKVSRGDVALAPLCTARYKVGKRLGGHRLKELCHEH